MATRGTSFYAATGLDPGIYTVNLSNPTADADLHLYPNAGYSLEIDCTTRVVGGARDCTLESDGAIYFSVSCGPLNREGAYFDLLVN